MLELKKLKKHTNIIMLSKISHSFPQSKLTLKTCTENTFHIQKMELIFIFYMEMAEHSIVKGKKGPG